MFSRFERLALATKLSIAFVFLIIVTAVVSGLTIWRVQVLVEMSETIYKKDLIGVSLLRTTNRDVNAIGRMLNRSLLARNYGDFGVVAEIQNNIDRRR